MKRLHHVRAEFTPDHHFRIIARSRYFVEFEGPLNLMHKLVYDEELRYYSRAASIWKWKLSMNTGAVS
jgi:hypothetical protein